MHEPDDRRVSSQKHLLITAAIVALTFFSVTAILWTKTSYFLDDYIECATMKTDGYGPMLEAHWSKLGLYRPLTVPAAMVLGPLCHSPAISKALGLVAHVGIGLAFGAFSIRGLGLNHHAAILASVAFIFNPLALEAIVWPAAMRVYVLAAAFLLIFAWRAIVTRKYDVITVALGVLAVMACEQTILVVLLLPLLTYGWRSALKIVVPIGVYILALKYLTPHPYVGGANVTNAFDNLAWLPAQVAEVTPGAPTWLQFALGPLGPGQLAIVGVIGTTAGIVKQRAIHTDGALRPILIGLFSAVALTIPLLLQSVPWWSPRMAYIPHLGIALLIAGLAALAKSKAVPVAALVLWLVTSVGGVTLEAKAYIETFRYDQQVASAIAAAALGQTELLVLANSPWTVTDDVPIVGEHIVHAFAPAWTPIAALRLLEGVTIGRVIVDHGGDTLCLADGVIHTSDGSTVRIDESTIAYDVTDQRIFTEDDASLPECTHH